MNKVREGILSAIGATPLVRLQRGHNFPFRLYAKLEALNPGGSIKDRTALSIIQHGFETGEIVPGTAVIESSSGNMGIGLAQICAYLGLRFICVVDPKTTSQNIDILRAYGAEIDLVSVPDAVTGEFLQARIDRVRELSSVIPNSFWPDQYSNPYNAHAHHATVAEIMASLEGEVDYIFCATSTCGTLRGCAEYVHEHSPATKVIAVDVVGSVIFGSKKARRLIPGHGAAIVPPLFAEGVADDVIHVTDLDCVVGCRRLVRREAILAGGSSGGAYSAIGRYSERIPANATCVVIFPDRGERYLDTIYSDGWVKQHFGAVSYLWEETTETEICETMTY
jgi:N-(2-amino-2-carboxyethyl)-L-glutamate synthase